MCSIGRHFRFTGEKPFSLYIICVKTAQSMLGVVPPSDERRPENSRRTGIGAGFLYNIRAAVSAVGRNNMKDEIKISFINKMTTSYVAVVNVFILAG